MEKSASFKSIREMLEEEELRTLSPFASYSSLSRGRKRYEAPCEIRPCYQRDRDRIIHSKSFRRLKHKTQVFLAPYGDHYRTRLTHTLEVSQIARTISKALFLNESLTEAIALGHDIGHTPFGHTGEAVLNGLCSGGFEHSEQSVRTLDIIEKEGRGLNLTYEVLDGIRNHRTSGHPATLEGQVVRISDKIAYLNHDVDDAIRAGLITEEDLPKKFTDVLGQSVHSRLNALILDTIYSSLQKASVSMSPEFEEAMRGLRSWMFENLYTDGRAKEEEQKAQTVVKLLFEYYMLHPAEMSSEYVRLTDEGIPLDRAVCDYISGMTDNYAVRKFTELFVPTGWTD